MRQAGDHGNRARSNGTRPRLCSVRTPPAPYRRRVEPPGHLGPYRCPSRDRGPRGAHAAFGGRGTPLGADHGLSLARGSVSDDLGRACGSDVPGRRQAAVAVMAEIGQRLASLLVTLHAPGTAAEQGWSPWRQDYLRHWATVGEVGIAGGLVAGPVGVSVVDATNSALVDLGPRLDQARAAAGVGSMLGAARCAGVADGTVVAVDLGQSTAKSGLVRMCQGEVSDLHTLRRSEVGFDLSAPVPAEQLETLLDDVLRAAATDAREHTVRVDAVAFFS